MYTIKYVTKLQHTCATHQLTVDRNVLNQSPRSHIGSDEFQEVNWLPINYRVFQIIVNHMFRTLNGKSPIYLQ